jgi:hypothetical protein
LTSAGTNLGTLSSLVTIRSLQGFKVLFQRRIFSPLTARKIPFFRLAGEVFSTNRTQFSDRTQKLTRQIEVEGRTTQTPSKKAIIIMVHALINLSPLHTLSPSLALTTL